MHVFKQNDKMFSQNDIIFKGNWSPTEYDNLVFWSNANVKNVKLNVSNLIYSWKDNSGNMSDAIQLSSIRQPVISKNKINGFPTIYFQNSKFLRINLNLDYYTIILVMQSSDNDFVYEYGDNAETSTGFYLNGSNINSISTTISGFTGSASVKSSPSNWLSSDWKIISHMYDGTHSGHMLFENNTFKPLNNTYTDDPGALNITQDLNLGCKSSGLNGINGYIAEILIFDRSISLDERTDIVNNLNYKYQIF